ncbi:MAG: plastocyanin [Patiriisocius sp.]|jgi:plastocyanin
MNKTITFLVLIGLLFTLETYATVFEIASTGDLSYSPNVVNATVGDTINFTISATHPTAEVSQATWDDNLASEMTSGFGTMTSSFTLVLEESDAPVLYYVCVNHVSDGMKGLINVEPTGLAELIQSIDFEFGPNPVSDNSLYYTTSKHNKISSIEIFDIQGKLVDSFNQINESGRLDLNLENGVYFVQLISTKNTPLITKKLIVQ